MPATVFATRRKILDQQNGMASGTWSNAQCETAFLDCVLWRKAALFDVASYDVTIFLIRV
jgi:hypothetical protein